jgi:hypothetical protein
MKNCPECGEELEESFDVCWKCGQQADASPVPTASMPLMSDGASKLLRTEEVVAELATDNLVLTTHRIRHRIASSGREEFVSIMLDQIATCGTFRRSRPLLILMAVLSIFLGFLSRAEDSAMSNNYFASSLVIALALIVAYLLTIRQVLELASAGTTIRANIKGMSQLEIDHFVNEIEKAKDQRYFQRLEVLAQAVDDKRSLQ